MRFASFGCFQSFYSYTTKVGTNIWWLYFHDHEIGSRLILGILGLDRSWSIYTCHSRWRFMPWILHLNLLITPAASYIKNEFDKLYGSGWQSIVSPNVSSFCIHSKWSFMYFSQECFTKLQFNRLMFSSLILYSFRSLNIIFWDCYHGKEYVDKLNSFVVFKISSCASLSYKLLINE